MHTKYATPNTAQTSAERKLKYALARIAGCASREAIRYRDWNWHPLRGILSQTLARQGGDYHAIEALCQEGYDMFKDITKHSISST